MNLTAGAGMHCISTGQTLAGKVHLVLACVWVARTQVCSKRASPVYQWRKAFLRNIAVNCSLTRLNISWMAVVLPMKVALILRPLGGISQMEDLTLLGIHSTK